MERHLKDRHALKVVRCSVTEATGVTLSDFFPQDSGHLMRAGGATVVISTRLRNALHSYAIQRGISLIRALELLRDEVNHKG